MSPKRDPYFGRFAFMVATIALVVIVLGLVFIWYLFQSGGPGTTGSNLAKLVERTGSLPPNQVILYYTKDGKQLTGTVADLGTSGMSSTEKAKLIVTKLLEGRDTAFLKSTIPAGTKLKSVFIPNNIAVVDLSREFMSNLRGGVDSEILAIYSIVDSILTNIDSLDAVQILIDGEKMLTLHGQIDISTPLVMNAAITRAS